MGRLPGDPPNSSPLRTADPHQTLPVVYPPPPENELSDYPIQVPAPTCDPHTHQNPVQFACQHQAGTYQPPPKPQAAPFPPKPVPCQKPHYPQPIYKVPPVNYQPGTVAGHQQQFNNHLAAGRSPAAQTYQAAEAQLYGALISPWTTGLFDCMEDPTNAVITLLFPCVTFGQVAEIVDSGKTQCATSALLHGAISLLSPLLPCVLSCGYRTKLRVKYGLLEYPAPDSIIHLLCERCALCQEYRELKNRGLDPGMGWHINMALQSQTEATMMSPVNQMMNAA